jgi:hypothetical protein
MVGDMPLSVEAREQLLAEPLVAALAVAVGPTRGPLTVPIWYHYPAGQRRLGAHPGEIAEGSAHRGGSTVHADGATHRADLRYVAVEGPVTSVLPGTDKHLHEISDRYLSPEAAFAYRRFARANLGEQVAIYLRPERWLSADLGGAS